MSSNGVYGYIHDGYTRDDGYIRAVDRLYPALRFSWRPVLKQNKSVISTEIARAGAAQAERFAARTLSKHVLKWDLKNKDGETVELTEEHILRVHPALFQRLFSMVIGNDPPDEVETAGEKPESDDFEAALSGMTLDEREVAEAKN